VCASHGVHDTTTQENQLAAQRINPMAAGAQINEGGTSVPGITPGAQSCTCGSDGKHGQVRFRREAISPSAHTCHRSEGCHVMNGGGDCVAQTGNDLTYAVSARRRDRSSRHGQGRRRNDSPVPK
jgi:hypothetical protein